MNVKSIEYVVERMGITSVKKNGDWVMLSCPLAPWTHAGGTDSRPSFGIKEDKGISGANCFSCGFKGGMLNLVRKYGSYAIPDGLWTKEEMDELVDFVILAEDEDEITTTPIRTEKVQIPSNLIDFLGNKHKYFTSRGITESTIKKWKLGYVKAFKDLDHSIYLEERVLFPVYEKEGLQDVLRGIIGRTVIDEEPKYKNTPPKFKKENYVYGGWLVDKETKIVVVEGPIDCLKVNQLLDEYKMDDYFAVALMGMHPSKEQIEWLKNKAEEVICILDNDPSGRIGTKKLIDALDLHLIVSVVSWGDFNDPDDAGEDVIRMIEEREPVLVNRMMRALGDILK